MILRNRPNGISYLRKPRASGDDPGTNKSMIDLIK